MSSAIQQALDLSKQNTVLLSYGSKQLTQEEIVPRKDAASPPAIKYIGTESGPFFVITLDLDPPYVSSPFLGPILHYLKADVEKNADGELSSKEQLASWVQPAPPPFSGPHRYLVLLYKQPGAFDVAAFKKRYGHDLPIYKRVRWSLADFAAEFSLTDLIAANYFKSV